MARDAGSGTRQRYRWNPVYGMSYSIRASLASSISTCGYCQEDMDAASLDSEEEISGDVVGSADHQNLFSPPHNFHPTSPHTNHALLSGHARRYLRLDDIDTLGVAPIAMTWNRLVEQETADSTSCESSESYTPRDAHRLRCSGSAGRNLKVHVFAERLRRNGLSMETLLRKKGKKALTFHDSRSDDGFVFGSREGEHCLLRIRIESDSNDGFLPIENITHVQLLYQTGRLRNLKIAEIENGPYRKETMALLEPETLRRRGGGSCARDETMLTEELIFQLHIRVALTDAVGREDDIVKTLCWRTVPKVKRTAPLCWKGMRLGNRMSHDFQAETPPMVAETADGRVGYQRTKGIRRRGRQMSSLLPRVSWNHTLNVCRETDA